MVKTFMIFASQAREADEDFFIANYPSRYRRSLQYSDSNDTLRCLAVALLLDKAGIKENEVTVDENGKPSLKNGGYISISHSGEYCALAVADAPVGIDIEQIGRVDDRIASRFFIETERQWAHGDAARLTVVWTVKEALAKLDGTGIKMLWNSVDVTPLVNGNELDFNGKKIKAEIENLDNNYIISTIT